MNRRHFLGRTILGGCGLTAVASAGCRHRTRAYVLRPDQRDMVGTTGAGAETFKPLVDTAVNNLLARHCTQAQAQTVSAPREPLRVCFVGVENKSAEEIGDFKEQIYEHIDGHLEQAHQYRGISKRYVDAALRETRLRPDELFLPKHMRSFTAVLEREGQPVDYLLYAKITSGTTRSGRDMQRDYVLTLELVDVRTGDFDKESAHIRKVVTL